MFDQIAKIDFNLASTFHALAILERDFPNVVDELDGILSSISIPILELVKGGGGEAKVTQRLRRALAANSWEKRKFDVQKTIDGRTTLAMSHEVDHVKDFHNGTIALEIEWNNKDPFFDRDLENFNRLHGDSGISVGIIVTRGSSMQEKLPDMIKEFAQKNRILSFSDLEEIGLNPTQRQKTEITNYQNSQGADFSESWATCFVRDKFASSTTHWNKLKARLDRGIGSPCPIIAFGIPSNCLKLHD